MLVALAHEIGKHPNQVSIEGHTDSRPYSGKGNYSNCELAADRANAARRLMHQNGLRPDQVSQVRGFADQRLRKADQPKDTSIRRISLIVQYTPKADTVPPTVQDPAIHGADVPSEPHAGSEPPKK